MVSLRTSPLKWCGNPPVLPGAYRHVFPLTGGFPRHLSALARNDSMILAFQLLIGIDSGQLSPGQLKKAYSQLAFAGFLP